MATVYLAHDRKHEREVALKVLLPEFSEVIGLERFTREIRTVAGLSHPHILPLYDSGDYDGLLYFVMPFIQGESLGERLNRETALTLEAATVFLRHVGDALDYAHSCGVVHRDLKPANILLSNGQALLADFGVSRVRATDALDTLTSAGTTLGTPHYMSPEQASAERDVDGRSDLYALACVAYEMLSGKRPFVGRNALQVMAQQIATIPDPVIGYHAPLPPSVADAIAKMLSKDPAERFHTSAPFTAIFEEAGAIRSSGPDSLPGTRAFRSRRLAVLPFETIGAEPLEGFTDGVHADLLDRLSGVSALAVISRSSVMRYAGSDREPAEIARDLGADWILQGTVRAAGAAVKVAASLVEVRDDRQVWGDSYRSEVSAEHLFDIQGKIASEIANALVALTPAEKVDVQRKPTMDIGAHLLYIKGRSHLDERTKGSLAKAVDYFELAIERDSSFALAWTGLADALTIHDYYGYPAPASVATPLDAVHRALEADPLCGEAHASLGIQYSLGQRGGDAVQELTRATELRPSHAEAYAWLAWVHLLMGKPGAALGPAKQAVAIDPLAPAYRTYLAEIRLANGQPMKALHDAERAVELQPDYPLPLFMRSLILYHLGRMKEARETVSAIADRVTATGKPSTNDVRALTAIIAAAEGDAEPLTREVSRVDAAARNGDGDDGPPDPFLAGMLRAAAGDRDGAFEWFDKVETWKDFAIEFLRYFFPVVLGPVRADPRYAALLARIDEAWGQPPRALDDQLPNLEELQHRGATEVP